MVEQQQKLVLSPYMDIYELVIPKDHLLWQITRPFHKFLSTSKSLLSFNRQSNILVL